jgi:hypothetical protein
MRPMLTPGGRNWQRIYTYIIAFTSEVLTRFKKSCFKSILFKYETKPK